MDCGPACLKSMLDGIGIHASYASLREACQTDVDGTSIDAIEDHLNALGAEAEQVLLPLQHVAEPSADTLPCIAIINNPNGHRHFIVVWRRLFGFVQIMDPARGRRWIRMSTLLGDCYLHRMSVPKADWLDWATGESFQGVQEQRLERLAVDAGSMAKVTDSLSALPKWLEVATIDATVRLLEFVRGFKGIATGREAARAMTRAASEVAKRGRSAIPERYWGVRPDESDDEQLVAEGVVLVRVRRAEGKQAADDTSGPTGAKRTDSAASTAGLLRTYFDLLGANQLRLALVALGIAVFSTIGLILEAVILRMLISPSLQMGAAADRVELIVAVLALACLIIVLDGPLTALAERSGSKFEVSLRMEFLKQLPNLPDRYFASRLVSDLASRAHAIKRVHEIPLVFVRLVRLLARLLLVTAAMLVLVPGSAGLVVLMGLSALLLPFVTTLLIDGQDMRVRTHAGALSTHYLDALSGIDAIKAHGADKAVHREHETLLTTWSESRLTLARTTALTALATHAVSVLLLALLVYDQLTSSASAPHLLLVVYWAAQMPLLAQGLGQLATEYPGLRNIVHRLHETIDVGRMAAAAAEAPGRVSSPPGIEFEGVTVHAGGHEILSGLDLVLEPGEHVAVVGSSGAGKSTLLGVLLGKHPPSSGRLLFDGRIATPTRLDALRRQVAWSEPGVRIWNDTMLDNLVYGVDGREHVALDRCLDHAGLNGVIADLPRGLQSQLGDAGRKLSGGEGQRVRNGRALNREDVGLVLLDEPFRGLPREERQRLLRLARQRWSAATFVYVSHDLAMAADFPRVLVMERGRIVEDLRGESTRRDGDRFRSLLSNERALAASLYGSELWRRIEVNDGCVNEDAPER